MMITAMNALDTVMIIMWMMMENWFVDALNAV